MGDTNLLVETEDGGFAVETKDGTRVPLHHGSNDVFLDGVAYVFDLDEQSKRLTARVVPIQPVIGWISPARKP